MENQEELFQQRKRIIDKLHSVMPGSQEYADLLKDLREITEVIAQGDKLEQSHTEMNHKIDMDEEASRLERFKAVEESSNAKWDTVWRFAGGIVSTAIMGILGLIGIKMTVELEEDAIPSRNGFGIASGMLRSKK